MTRPEKIDRSAFMDQIGDRTDHHETGSYGEGHELDDELVRRENEDYRKPVRDQNGRFAKGRPSTDPNSPYFDPEADGSEGGYDDDFDPEEEYVDPKKAGKSKAREQDEDIDFEKEFMSKKFKAKVDGVEEDVSVEDMLRSYQKSRAADERLRRASEVEKDLAQRQQQLLELQQRLLEQSKTSKRDEPAPKPSDEDAEKELFDAIFSGDEKRAAKAMAERDRAIERRLVEELSRKTIEIEEQAVRKASEAATKQTWDSYMSEVASERDDIVGDRFLVEVFNAHLADAVGKKGHTRDAVRDAEAAFDEWASERGIKVKTRQQQEQRREEPKGQALEERVKRSERAKRLSTGTPASAKSKGEQQREVYKTGSASIQEMSAQRKPWAAVNNLFK